jgi:DNA gyrase/topoisomerase IV subunit A
MNELKQERVNTTFAIYIKNEKKFEKINSLKNLLKFFISHQTEIETYSKENKTDFNQLENVKHIVEYAFSLEKSSKSF